eukprot:3140436-Prymnesium_polylepis.1
MHRSHVRDGLAVRAYPTDGPARGACDGSQIAPEIALVPNILRTRCGSLRAVRAEMRHRSLMRRRMPGLSHLAQPTCRG